ncbi:MAG: ABC transporter substrate-binding protein [Proteobacteria bacterium]|nr:ABC transporter substrate-binding protein [Pseudomonadota bacterium]
MKLPSRLTALLALLLAALVPLAGGAVAAETLEFRISRQPSILYLQNVLMEDGKLIEKHAALLGLPGVNVKWILLTSGGPSTEALLADSLDIVTSGTSNMLLVWGKTNGGVKGITAVCGLPLLLYTRNPEVKTIKDFGPKDRIAVPTLQVSMQSTILGMELEKIYGPGGHSKLDALQVQLGHPDAMQSVLNPTHEVNSHFGAPPFTNIALKTPGVHAVLSSIDVLGGPAQITVAFGSQRFVDANPIKIKAFIAAMDEAADIIAKDPKRAAEIYLSVNKEKVTVDELVDIIKAPGALFSATPQRTMLYAEYMNRIGLVKPKAASWKDYFISQIHDRQGS